MQITIFTINKRFLYKRYSQIEVHEQDVGLVYESPYLKLVHKRGRPAKLWHWVEGNLNDNLNIAFSNAGMFDDFKKYSYSGKEFHEYLKDGYIKKKISEDLEYQSVFGRKWIEENEFKRITANAHLFLFEQYV